MSQENVEILRRGYAYFFKTGEVRAHPELVWDVSHLGWPDQQMYSGPEGAAQFMAEWAEAWDDWEMEVEDFLDAGDRVVVMVNQRGRSKATGLAVEMRFAQVWTLRDGQAVRMQMYADTDEALAAVGLAGAEFVLDTTVVRSFVAHVRTVIAAASSPGDACDAIRPRFAELLADPDWLPGEYQAAAPDSGMGGGIGQWLLYRAGDGSMSLFSLVVPPGSQTPIHDHLAWGLVGLYRGAQDEEIYAVRNGALELVEERALGRGDFYVLIPPRDDIHRVRTTSVETSVSIHLLTNDTGCVWRHAYEAGSGEATPFRSGYVNVACEDDD